MINEGLLRNWSCNCANDTCVSSCSSGEFLENWSRITFVTLEARVKSIWTILPLEIFTCIFLINRLNTDGWVAEVCISNAVNSLLRNIIRYMEDFFLNKTVNLTVLFGILSIVNPDC
jgi:hypothetical protein